MKADPITHQSAHLLNPTGQAIIGPMVVATGGALLVDETTTMKKVILLAFVGGMISFLMFLVTGLIVSGLPVSHI